MGALDLIMSAMGQPDPRMQLMHAMGQAPGQPGGGGPVPGAPVQGGQQGQQAAGGAPMAQQQPQQQAYTSPPDLASAYMQLAMRQNASESFDRHMAMLAGGLYPGRATAINAAAARGQPQDPGALFNNLLQLQQYGVQQQNMQQFRQNLPGIMSSMHLDPSLAPLLTANPDILSKIVETRAGIGGDSVTQELNSERSNWRDQNPGKSDAQMFAARPELAGPVEFQADRTQQVNAAAAKTKDLIADQHDFTSTNADYGETEQMLGWLKDHPDAAAAAVHYGGAASGRIGQLGQAVGALPSDTATAAGYLAQLQGKLYSEGWKGRGGRLSQLEAGKISEGFSQLNNPALPDDQITAQIGRLYAKTQTARANAYGIAGMPTPATIYGRMDQAYKQGGKLYSGATSVGDDDAPTSTGSVGGALKPLSGDDLAQAKTLIARDGRDAVIAHLKASGYDTSGL